MQACDRTGHFRAEVLDYGLKKADSGAVSIALHFLLTESYDEQAESWGDWRQYDMEVYGDVWVIKKDGTLNDKSAQRLMSALGWDGTFASISETTWKPTPCQVQVGRHEYQNQTSYRVDWVNQFDSVPGKGALGNVDDDGVKQLESRFGSTLRALQGNVRRPATPTAGRPPAPPKAANSAPVGAGAKAGDDGIPF